MRRLFLIAAAVMTFLGGGLVMSYGGDDSTPKPKPPPSSDTWKDPTSGLMWQVSPTGGERMTWAAAKSHCESLTLGGHSDWRLPTISELRSLASGCPATRIGGSCRVTDSCLNLKCLNDACSTGCSATHGPGPEGAYWSPKLSGDVSAYWSSSVVADSDNYFAWLVGFYYGRVYHSHVLGNKGTARCVRTDGSEVSTLSVGPPVPAADTWKDSRSGLMWQVSPPDERMKWSAAKDYCTHLSLGGLSGWRLPTISEFRTLIRGCPATQKGGSCRVKDNCLNWTCRNDSCGGRSLLGGPGQGGAYWPGEISGETDIYWSSSVVADLGYGAWVVDFHHGDLSYGIIDSYYARARCVR